MSASGNTVSVESVSPEQRAQALKRKYVPRATQACQVCRRKKTKCDQGRPACSICTARGCTCIYEDVPPSSKRVQVTGQTWLLENHPQNSHPPRNSQEADQNPNIPAETRWQDTNRDVANSNTKPWGDGTSISKNVTGLHTSRAESQGQELSSQIAPPEQQPEFDSVGGLNQYTQGVEFYGTSSNFALLGSLLSKARSRILPTSNRDSGVVVSSQTARDWLSNRSNRPGALNSTSGGLLNSEGSVDTSRALKDDRASLVNLLFDEESALQDFTLPSRAKTPDLNTMPQTSGDTTKAPDLFTQPSKSKGTQSEYQSNNGTRPATAGNTGPKFAPDDTHESKKVKQVEIQLEREYMRIFFNNLHYIHPFLSSTAFATRCEQEIYGSLDEQHLRQRQLHFFALYNAVLAVGALTAGTDLLLDLRRQMGMRTPKHNSVKETGVLSSIDLSVVYFRRAKKFLGDYFEVGSLESVQALILMSLYCQNALRPHACYMYSGMAVRTALAIGLPDEVKSGREEVFDEARKTWWAVYSQEVDMCCSSGRRSSLMNPETYPIPLPDTEGDGTMTPISMISEMVRFAAILLRISHQIYHRPKSASREETSSIAIELDKDLKSWKANLPPWLNSQSHLFKEPEWAGKQRLVLQLRFYNAIILIHRPLMVLANVSVNSQLQLHTAACLHAARKTIDLLYESYTHRHYFRTWYYNSTYTLYASMLLLYIIITSPTHGSHDDLIHDVEKSLDILHAMEHVKVALRCANLIREVLEIVRRQQKYSVAHNDGLADASVNLVGHSTEDRRLDDRNPAAINNMPLAAQIPLVQHDETIQDLFSTAHFAINNTTEEQSFDIGNGSSVMQSNLLASIMDPINLEGFASDMISPQHLISGLDWVGIDSGSWLEFDIDHMNS